MSSSRFFTGQSYTIAREQERINFEKEKEIRLAVIKSLEDQKNKQKESVPCCIL